MRHQVLRGQWLLVAAMSAVVALAFAVRLPVLLRSGGLLSAVTVDDGVHYAAAASLLAGRVPYRDFLFLHPPGIMLALLPFAALGRAVGDPTAFAAARAVFIGIGAGSTGLAVLVLRRFGLGPACAGAAVLACSFPIVYAERSALLEPLGAAGLLGALALQAGRRTRRERVATGVLLGLVVVVKLPFLVPAVVVALAVRRGAVVVLCSAAITAAAVCTPFLVLAGPAMVEQIVTDQLGRRRIVPSITERLGQMFPSATWPGIDPRIDLVGTLVLVGVLVVVALTTAGARRLGVLLVADTVELLVGPSFYGHYAILAALPAALLVGVLAARLRALVSGAAARGAIVCSIGVLAAGLALSAWSPTRIALLTTEPVPPALTRAIHTVPGCVTADNATTLILTDMLTTLLRRDCPLRPDFTGWQFADRTGSGPSRWPDQNPVYQRRALAYLRSGEATVLTASKDGLTSATRAAALAGPTLWAGPRGSLHLTREP